MKKHTITKLCMLAGLVAGLLLTPPAQLDAQAAETATVHGTILSGTSAELLKLSTSDGNMEIKLDAGTDTSSCKVLLPNKKVTVNLTYGSDAYWHASKITSEAPDLGIALDSDTTATVTGTVGKKTSGDILFFETPQGEMEIKLDATTNMSGCSFLVMGKPYEIVCARGSDAYMHAISISDVSSSSKASSVPAGVDPSSMKVTGTVGNSTNEDILYLATKDGEMQFKIDSNANTDNGFVLTPDNKLTVYFYHGNDGYLHATGITGDKESGSDAKVDTSDTSTVTGTVEDNSTENILFLDTKYGVMELKLDTLKSLSNCKVLVAGKKVSLTCAYGSDAYMHAVDITGF